MLGASRECRFHHHVRAAVAQLRLLRCVIVLRQLASD